MNRNIYRRLLTLFLCVTCIFQTALSQERTITGLVKDDKGNPLSGATVAVKGTAAGTTTDSAGNFTLRAAPRAVLVITYVGMGSTEVTVTGDFTTVTLQSNAQGLDEVVVVGYGTSRRKDLTGAVSTIKTKEITQTATADPLQAMQGRVAGVQIVANSGEPGSGTKVRIRGVGSVNGSTPIYVVDGFQTPDISYIAPGDIESMDILKDASASAIYGARGANGVIVITTKKGKSGAVKFNLDAYTGLSSAWRKLPLTNATQYATLVEEAYTNENEDVPVNIKPKLDSAKAGYYGAGTNWQDEIFRTALMQNYSLGMSGGGEVNRFRLSGTYFNQQGIVKNTYLQKYFFNFTDDIKINKWLKSGVTFNFAHNDKSNYNGDLYGGVLTNTVSADPITPVHDATGNWGRPGISYANNPARVVSEIKGARTRGNLLVGNIFAEATLIKGLTFRTQFNTTYNNIHTTTYLPEFYMDNVEQRSQSSLYDYRGEEVSWMWTNYFNYTHNWGKHNLAATAGAELQNFHHQQLEITAYDVPADADLQYIYSAQSTTYSVTSSVTFPIYSYGLQSYFARANYSYDDKYLLTATLRNDASSKFVKGNRSGIFPSFGAGWVVSRERFLEDSKTISYLKLRAGWGEVGNEQSANPYPYITGVTGNNLYVIGGQTVQGFAPNSYGNANLKWEVNQQSNIGVDINFLKNKLTFSTDLFYRKTKDMILPVPVPLYSGAPASPQMNTGSMVNKGIEAGVGVNGGKKFTYNIGANVTYLNNKLTSLGLGDVTYGGSTGKLGNITGMAPGLSFPFFYGLKTDGIFHNQAEVAAYTKNGTAIQPGAQPGDVKFVDYNNDGVIDGNDYTNLGNPNPKFQFGFNADFSYQQFDLRLFLQGVTGNKIINALDYNIQSVSNEPGGWFNFMTDRLDRWTPSNPNTNQPRMSVVNANNNMRFSDRYVENGSYLRMKNVQIGYTIPKKTIARLGITNARFYLSADNLFTITGYKGFDPEVNGYYSDAMYTGIDVGGYPQSRTFRVGLNMGF